LEEGGQAAAVRWEPAAGRLVLHGLFERPVPLTVELVWTSAGSPRRWALGPTERAEPLEGGWRFDLGELWLDWLWQPAAGGLRIDCRLTVRAAGDIALWQLVPARFGGELPPLEALERVRFYRNGFQSWTPSGSVPATSSTAYPWVRSFALMSHFVDSPSWGRRDGLLSNQFTVLAGRDEPRALLAGFLAQRRGLGEAFLQNRGGRGLHLSLDYGGKLLGPGEVLEGEPLLLARGQASALLDAYADQSAAAMGARPLRRRSPVGWCSWYELYTRVSEADVRANLEALRERPHLGVEVVQVDDGYQADVGDWLVTNEKFPQGMEPLAREVKRQGFQAGIWLAPFMAVPRARLVREHPEWVLRDERGRPRPCGFNPMWRSGTVGLDLSHPEVLSWLAEVFGTLVAQGYDYFKIDFLFAALRHGRRRNPRLSPVEAYREGLAVIRRAIGEERFLLGCGAPLGPSVGFVDAMRVSADVKEEWRSWLYDRIGRDCASPSARNCLTTNITRQFLHRRWWLNDPDCLLVRDRRTCLTQDEVHLLVTVLGMSGGMLLLSDDLSRLAPERLRQAEAVLPPSVLSASAPELLEEALPRRFLLEGPRRRLVAHLNWEDSPAPLELPEHPAPHRFDFWKEEVLRAPRGEVPAHGVRALLETPPAPHPVLVGTTLHLAALVDGRIDDTFEPASGVLRLTAREIARRQGTLWIAVPECFELDRQALPPQAGRIEAWEHGITLGVELSAPWALELRFIDRRPRAAQEGHAG
jgi:alpha-galactosidase